MTRLKVLPAACIAMFASVATAHEGHGVVGSVGHDMQHQLWIFAAMIVTGALLLAGDRLLALVRSKAQGAKRRAQPRQQQ